MCIDQSQITIRNPRNSFDFLKNGKGVILWYILLRNETKTLRVYCNLNGAGLLAPAISSLIDN